MSNVLEVIARKLIKKIAEAGEIDKLATKGEKLIFSFI